MTRITPDDAKAMLDDPRPCAGMVRYEIIAALKSALETIIEQGAVLDKIAALKPNDWHLAVIYARTLTGASQ